MDTTKIYIELSEEVEAVLSDNMASIEDILDSQNVQVQRISSEPKPYQTEQGATDKDLVTMILAGSVAVTAIGFAVSQLLRTLQNKPILVKAYDVVEIKHTDGSSETKLIENPKLLEPTKDDKKTEIEANFKLLGVSLKFSSE